MNALVFSVFLANALVFETFEKIIFLTKFVQF